MKKFNILYVIEGGPNWGGAEEMLLNVMKVIDRNRFSVEVCCLVGGYVAEELKTAGAPVTVLNMKDKWDYRAVSRLVSMLKMKNIHIIHTCLYTSNTFGRIAAIIARTPITVAWEQSMAYVKPRRHMWVDWFLNKFTHFIVVPSEAVKQSVIESENISGLKIEVVHNMADMAKFAVTVDVETKRAELGLKPDDIVVGFVASLSEKKGHKYLLDATPEVIRVFPNVRFLLVGEGPLRGEIEEKIKMRNLEGKVILLGFRKDIPEILSILDFYVHPSLMEGLSLSIMEAMAMGKPVVASRVGGTPEVVKDGETGILVPARDSRAIAEAITGLLKDKETASEMGRAGSELIRAHFTPEASVGRLEKLYEKFVVTQILAGGESLDEEEEELRRCWTKKYFSYEEFEPHPPNPSLDYQDEVRRKALLKLLKLVPGERVLDVGCGYCGDISSLYSDGIKFVGIDFSEGAVVKGKKNLRDDGKDAPLMVADALRLPFKDGVFDKVYCKESLEHIPDYEAAIREIGRVLRAGGVIAITCPNWLSIKGLGRIYRRLIMWAINRGENHPYDNWKTQMVVERSLRKHGFEIKDRLGIDFLPGIRCYKLSKESQVSLVKTVRFLESMFLWRLTAFGNGIALSAIKKSDNLQKARKDA